MSNRRPHLEIATKHGAHKATGWPAMLCLSFILTTKILVISSIILTAPALTEIIEGVLVKALLKQLQ